MNKTALYGRVAASALLMTLAIPTAQAAPPTSSSPAGQASGVAHGAKLQLRWEVQRTPLDAQGPRDTAPARFILTNRDTQMLPAHGWSLYFNSIDRLPAKVESFGILLEQVAGGLFRLRPGPAFTGLAPGQTVEVPYRHHDQLYMPSKAPSGPYLVYDNAPTVGVALDYAVLPLELPAQVAQGSPHAAVTPQDTYRRNARAERLPVAAVPLVVPTPLTLASGKGRLALQGSPKVNAPISLATEAALARSLFPSGQTGANGPALTLSVGKVPGQASPEAYRLTIDAGRGIAIVGNSAAGVAHGLQTLRELMPLPGAAAQSLPLVSIVDAPRFAYRGFMLDVARNFHSKETVFKWLDLMARFKLNKFHFHLTEDEGWRLEIAGMPELTAIGAVRGHAAQSGVRLQPAYGSGPDPRDASGSGYYTRADYIEILRYAAERHIEVIPEIEMPGHARAAVQAMESRYHRLKAAGDKDAARYLLNDLADTSVYQSPQMYDDHVINPGLDSAYTFVEHVVAQVVALHREAGVQLSTIHMGGDELPEGAWEKSPASRAMMAREGLASTADLWNYFYGRVDAIVRKHGLFTSGWEEMAARRGQVGGGSGLVANPHFVKHGFTAYVWNNTPGNEDLAYRLANAGYDIVLTPVTRLYLDMAHNANPTEYGVNWGGYVELDTVYDFVPFDMNRHLHETARSSMVALSEQGRRRVRGLQANLWTETVRDAGRIDYLVMPRLAAVAERAWAAEPAWAREADPRKADKLHRTAWSGFANALGQRVLPRLDLEGGKLAYRIAPPGLIVEQGQVLANHMLPGMQLRYTSDGRMPTASSRQVSGPIAERGLIRVAAFDRNGRMSEVAGIEHR